MNFYSCEPLPATHCQTWFPRTFNNAIQVPGRTNKEDIFNILINLSPSLDAMCKKWLNFIACAYVHPRCNENGECVH